MIEDTYIDHFHAKIFMYSVYNENKIIAICQLYSNLRFFHQLDSKHRYKVMQKYFTIVYLRACRR